MKTNIMYWLFIVINIFVINCCIGLNIKEYQEANQISEVYLARFEKEFYSELTRLIHHPNNLRSICWF